MSQYHKDLFETLTSHDRWPSISRPDFVEKLDDTAHEAFRQQTVEGYLAAFLIYQQISEEMVRNIIKLGRLYNQAAVFPLKVEYDTLDDPKLTFGVLLKYLKSIPHEDLELARLCKELNKLRIQLVHKLTQKESLEDIQSKCQRAVEIFGEIERNYYVLEDEYLIGLGDYRDTAEDRWPIEYSELLS